ncbi:MAG: DegT/DnrJ/EryC1/StrS family aminotransferase, partial [Syntrophorhabdales bacterium]
MEKVPVLDLVRQYRHMEADIRAAIENCLKHQKWILGPEVAELEKTLAQYLGVSHCIGVSSGTDALVLSLRAMAIKLKGKEYFDREDEIITTSFTFTATGDAILRSGATPVFVDIDPLTFNLNPDRINDYMARNGKRVVGIVPVHLYGRPCEMDAIMQIAASYGLFVIEDAAQAFGATLRGRSIGSLGDVGAFSFFPSKNLGGFGDGGMVSTNDDATAALVRMLSKHGGKDKYNV